MAERTLNGSVGASPAANHPDDVRTVQELLGGVDPPLSIRVAVTGTADGNTVAAIREFQRRYMANPDGRVDPDGRSLMHLNDGFSPSYIGCSPLNRVRIDRSMIEAQKWLDLANRRLGTPSDTDMREKVRNIFHVDPSNPDDSGNFFRLRTKFRRLRASFDERFPFQCEPIARNIFRAYVDMADPDGTMHFNPAFFHADLESCIATVIHERAHTVLRADHGGMTGAGEVDFGHNPDDHNHFDNDFEQAINNAYAYEWLATSLQPTYQRQDLGEVITGAL